MCLGSPQVHRLTPDFGKALDLGPRWDERIALRLGQWYWGRDGRPADKRRLFLEYPSGGWAARRLLAAAALRLARLAAAA